VRLLNCRMPKGAAVVEPERKVLEELERRTRNRAASARESQRAKLILLYLDGVSKSEISRRLDLSRMRVIDWIKRFEDEGLAGLKEREGRGRKEGYTAAQRKRIVDTVCRKPKKGLSRWSVRTLARHLGFDKDKVHRVLNEHDLHPHRLRTFNYSPDPQFEEKLLEVVGLYMDPPENAIVLCMDEKTGIQALDRTQPLLNLRSKKPRAWSNEYVRHGTRTMLAAVEIETGKATTWVNKTRKTVDFIKFMNQVVKEYPRQRLCVVMDNLNTHKGKGAQQWLKDHPEVTFHYTPTHASWVNLAECFFSIVSKQGLQQAVHRSARELERFLNSFVLEYNKHAVPFVWTKGPEKLQRIIELTKEFQQKTA
jgi:transposase